ncbi:hypothetical protein [Mycobacterium sp. URHB0021]|jgi:hypothetical protein
MRPVFYVRASKAAQPPSTGRTARGWLAWLYLTTPVLESVRRVD